MKNQRRRLPPPVTFSCFPKERMFRQTGQSRPFVKFLKSDPPRLFSSSVRNKSICLNFAPLEIFSPPSIRTNLCISGKMKKRLLRGEKRYLGRNIKEQLILKDAAAAAAEKTVYFSSLPPTPPPSSPSAEISAVSGDGFNKVKF